MNLNLLVGMMWKRLIRFKMKSIFMMLGIVISVIATILVRTVGVKVTDSFNSFIKSAYAPGTITLITGGSFEGRVPLTLDEVETVANSIGSITAYEPFLYSGFRDIKNQGANLSSIIYSSSDQAPFTTSRGIEEGDFFSAEEVRSRDRVALLGPKTAMELFGEQFPIGETFFIDNLPYTVKGVLEEAGFDPHGTDRDYAVLIPYTTLMSQLKVNYVSGARYLVEGDRPLEEVEEEVTQIMRELHNISEGQDDDFKLHTAAMLLEAVRSFFRIFDVFLPLIVVVTFLISGVVILSIMVINVRQRTPEIGLRKALGARPADLKLQFLLEVSLLCVIGAGIGVLLSLPIARLLSPIFEQKYGTAELVPSPGVMLFSVLAAVAVGTLAGYLPAVRAARMDPIDAIR